MFHSFMLPIVNSFAKNIEFFEPNLIFWALFLILFALKQQQNYQNQLSGSRNISKI